MRVAFYAPLKPPGHRVPSGDRRLARLLLRAIAKSGNAVSVASRMRAFDGSGDTARQDRIRRRVLNPLCRRRSQHVAKTGRRAMAHGP